MKPPNRIPRPNRWRHLGAFAVVSLAASLLPAEAQAGEEVNLRVDWNRLVPLMVSPFEMLQTHSPVALVDPSAPVPLVGSEPRVTIVARDWSSSRGLWGETSAIDELRPSRSSRMLVSRLRLAHGRVAPYAQLGGGEWHVDPTLMPSLPREHEFAGQGGFGFELALSSQTTLGVEADWTVLMRTGNADVVADKHPAFWTGALAMRTRF